MQEAFQGSLPTFVAAFTSRKQLSDTEINELISIIQGKKEK